MPKRPAPFKAPRIDLTQHGKSWKEALPGELSVGDNVMNFGIIQDIRVGDRGLEFLFAGNPIAVHFANEPIHAFTKG